MSLLPSRSPETRTAQEGEMQVVGVDEDVEPLLDALGSETARAVLGEIYEEPGTPSELADRLDMSIQNVSYHLEKLEAEELISIAGTQYSEKGQEMTVYQPPEEPVVLFVGTEERKNSLKTMVKRLLPTIGILALGSLLIDRLFGPGGFGPVLGLGAQSGASYDSAGREGAESGSAEPVATGGTNATGTESGGGSTETATPAPETATEAPDATTDAVGQTDVATEAPETTSGGADIMIESAETATETPGPSTATTPPEAIETTQQATDAAAAGGGGLSPGMAFFLGGLVVLAILLVFWGYRRHA
jgi:DNA-binding transcriptional ArsR family regulator